MNGVKENNGLSFFKSFLNFFNDFPFDQWKLILRTFGHDGKDVLKTLLSLSKIEQNIVEIYLRCGKDCNYFCETTNQLITKDTVVEFLKNCPPIVLIHDDPNLWLSNNEKREFAKPMFDIPEFTQLFIDDNITTSDETNIVNFLEWNQELNKWQQKSIASAENNDKIIQVVRYEALFDNYFKDLLQKFIHLRESTIVSLANENA
jgi:hypothetical protein